MTADEPQPNPAGRGRGAEPHPGQGGAVPGRRRRRPRRRGRSTRPASPSPATSSATEDVDLVLLDMNLPDGNGLTLARELRRARRAARPAAAAVVAVTASVLPQDRAAAMEAGCDGFLDKPYAAADLVATVVDPLSHPTAPPTVADRLVLRPAARTISARARPSRSRDDGQHVAGRVEDRVRPVDADRLQRAAVAEHPGLLLGGRRAAGTPAGPPRPAAARPRRARAPPARSGSPPRPGSCSPTAVRRSAVRCPPTPSAVPRSRAMARM